MLKINEKQFQIYFLYYYILFTALNLHHHKITVDAREFIFVYLLFHVDILERNIKICKFNELLLQVYIINYYFKFYI